MGQYKDSRANSAANWIIATVVIALNIMLLWNVVAG
jgi:hypothetical protein